MILYKPLFNAALTGVNAFALLFFPCRQGTNSAKGHRRSPGKPPVCNGAGKPG